MFLDNIKIKNFKSIDELEFQAKRINLFLGQPNAGKSNILEALGLFTVPYLDYNNKNLFEIIRAEELNNLFYDLDNFSQILIDTDKIKCTFTFIPETNLYELNIDFDKQTVKYLFDSTGTPINEFSFIETGIKLYRFRALEKFKSYDTKELIPPFGFNLDDTIHSSDELSSEINNIIQNEGKKLSIRQKEHKIEAHKEKNDRTNIHFPYKLFSDGFKRIMFNLAVIGSNNDSVILLEEPEAYYFPHYSTLIAEKIAESKNNQFFVSTHNPYFLSTILQNTDYNSLNVLITYVQEYGTRIKCLTEQETQEIIDKDIDAFFNLERFIDD